jgi:hypothetical protein
MARTIRIAALLLFALVLGALLALDVAYGWRGSLEWFPTAGQQDKVRVVTRVIGGGLGVLEFATLFALWRQWRAPGRNPPAHASSTTTPDRP